MSNKFLCALLIAWTTVSVSKISLGQSKESTDAISGLRKRLQQELDQATKEEGFPGASLAVVLKDGTKIELASGLADRDAKGMLKAGSRMFCGSTGKTFVSAVVLRLIEAKKLKLDDLAAGFFENDDDKGWFLSLPNASKITIRSLLNHTSGLPRYLFQKAYLADLKKNPFRSREPREGLRALVGAKALHSVGEGWSYSDSNYIVLGLIVEKVTGERYYDIVERDFLQPLKLQNTIPATQPELQGLVQGHIGSNNFFGLPKKTVSKGRYALNPDFEWCGGGFVTNAGDLAKWLHALHSGNILGKELHKELVTPVDFRTGKASESGYGLGSFVWKTKQGLFYGHAGIMPGYLTQIEYSKKHGFAIAFQTNTDEGLGRRHHLLVQQFAEIVIESTR